MSSPTAINLNSFLGSNLDFSFLKKTGLEYLESIASQLWTDYNTHDPGITILDMLCYAITDLAARTQLPIGDLIAESPQHSFLTAGQILPNAALTLADYRKLLIDQDGIRDSILQQSQTSEVSIYYRNQELGYIVGHLPIRIQLKGLNNIKLELEDDLNEDWIESAHKIDFGGGLLLPIHYCFDLYKPGDSFWSFNANINSITCSDPIGYKGESGAAYIDRYYVELDILLSNGQKIEKKAIWVLLKKPFLKAEKNLDKQIKEKIKKELSTLDGVNPVLMYKDRLKTVEANLIKLGDFLQAQRNLCEDWYDVIGSGIQKVGIYIEELELIPVVDKEAVVGQIYFEIDQFLAPFYQFQSLNELFANGKLPEQIFEGPLLKNGFLTDQQITQKERGGNIYTSDLLALIMNIKVDGVKPVKGVKGLEIVSYINRHMVAKGVKNCLRPRDRSNFKLRFSTFHSSIKVKQENNTKNIDADIIGFQKYIKLKEALKQHKPPGSSDIPVPKGKKRDVGNYHSIQHDFPAAYKLKAGAITTQDGSLRKAQAKQLKAYLLFFEQLLANYCSQLANLEQVFSTDPLVAKTYFFQPLHMIPEVGAIIKDDNGYAQQLEKAEPNYLQRRNQMLDHLLARFGEQFSEYAAKVYQNNSNLQLIKEKLSFLNAYPEFSSKRACAFDYCRKKQDGSPDVWDTENVSGFEKRVSGLLGIPQFRRKHLYKAKFLRANVEVFDKRVRGGIKEARFRILNRIKLDPNSQILLESTEHYPIEALEDAQKEVFLLGSDPSNFETFRKINFGKLIFGYKLLDEKKDVIATGTQTFDSLQKTLASIDEISKLFHDDPEEGFHVIEHILLRPRKGQDPLLPIPKFPIGSKNQLTPYFHDPYSAQVTIVLPELAGRFKNQGFRSMIEKMMRMELPAHIFPYFIWVSNTYKLKAFENAYKRWLNALCSKTDLTNITNELIKQLKQINTPIV